MTENQNKPFLPNLWFLFCPWLHTKPTTQDYGCVHTRTANPQCVTLTVIVEEHTHTLICFFFLSFFFSSLCLPKLSSNQFTVSLVYITSFRSTRATLWDPISKNEIEERKGERKGRSIRWRSIPQEGATKCPSGTHGWHPGKMSITTLFHPLTWSLLFQSWARVY